MKSNDVPKNVNATATAPLVLIFDGPGRVDMLSSSATEKTTKSRYLFSIYLI